MTHCTSFPTFSQSFPCHCYFRRYRRLYAALLSLLIFLVTLARADKNVPTNLEGSYVLEVMTVQKTEIMDRKLWFTVKLAFQSNDSGLVASLTKPRMHVEQNVKNPELKKTTSLPPDMVLEDDAQILSPFNGRKVTFTISKGAEIGVNSDETKGNVIVGPVGAFLSVLCFPSKDARNILPFLGKNYHLGDSLLAPFPDGTITLTFLEDGTNKSEIGSYLVRIIGKDGRLTWAAICALVDGSSTLITLSPQNDKQNGPICPSIVSSFLANPGKLTKTTHPITIHSFEGEKWLRGVGKPESGKTQ